MNARFRVEINSTLAKLPGLFPLATTLSIPLEMAEVIRRDVSTFVHSQPRTFIQRFKSPAKSARDLHGSVNRRRSRRYRGRLCHSFVNRRSKNLSCDSPSPAILIYAFIHPNPTKQENYSDKA